MAPPVSATARSKHRPRRATQYRAAPASAATGRTQHGNIDDDAKTQASAVAHILGRPIAAT